MKTFVFLSLFLCLFTVPGITAQTQKSTSEKIVSFFQQHPNTNLSFKEKTLAAVSLNESAQKSSQKEFQTAMLDWEASISKGEGGKALPVETVAKATKKFPGNTPEALQGRFKMYILQMERVHEDE
ncbi:MAG: hypothetical protein KDC91_08925 [Flavobacteriaceae bacterium]|nr:hypothetical protein [Flavobacteriaceae bacterium]